MLPNEEFTALVLDLEKLRGDSSNRVLAGRDFGELARVELRLDALDEQAEKILVMVPDDLYSVTSSWFLGAFADSIRSLGPAGFRKKYSFAGKPIERVVEEAIRAVELTKPLG